MSLSLDSIQKKLENQQPINVEEGKYLYNFATLSELKDLSSRVRRRYHPERHASYLMMAIVNYTNICVAGCDYCSFYRYPHQKDGYQLSFEQVCRKIDSFVALGGDLVGFNGGFHPKLDIYSYAKMFGSIRERYPNLEFYEMTVAEFMYASKLARIPYAEAASLMKAAGVKFISGGGAEILAEGFRKRHSPGKYTVDDYFTAQAAILDSGLGSTATMVIGFDETLDERFEHLSRLREFQESQHNKLVSFLCWTYKPFNNKLGGEEISSQAYWRWMAISRIFLDNFKHIRTSVLTKNEAALDALEYGADDFDLPTEDEVTQKAGAHISLEFEKILTAARDRGWELVHRRPFSLGT